jgi:hypothetical protein
MGRYRVTLENALESDSERNRGIMLVNIDCTAAEAITKVYLLELYREQKFEFSERKGWIDWDEMSELEQKKDLRERRKLIKVVAEVLTYLGVRDEKDY